MDTHNDILTMTMEKGHVMDNDLQGKTHSDLSRYKKGGVDIQCFSVWSDGEKLNTYDFANRQIDYLDAVVARNPDKIIKVSSVNEAFNLVKEHKISAFMGL